MEIDGVASMLEAAQMAANAGDMLVAEEALADAYNRISKILKDIEARERSVFGGRAVRPSVAVWRNGDS
jgi:hypothetical protein